MGAQVEEFAGMGFFVSDFADHGAADVREAPTPTPSEYPRTFPEFVGQQQAVQLLRTEVEAARRERRPLAHLLFYGAPGLGKTAMAHVLAAEMGAVVYESTGAEFTTQASMLEALASIGRLHEATGRLVFWLIDEVDGMTRVASYVVDSLMTHGYVTWQGERYGRVPITVMGTANAGGEPRKVNRRILRNVVNLLSGFFPTADLATVKQALQLSGLHPGGLSTPQVEYLRFLGGVEGYTAGLASVAAYLGMDTKDVQFGEEPYLIRSGLVTVTRSGRQLTRKGRDYLRT